MDPFPWAASCREGHTVSPAKTERPAQPFDIPLLNNLYSKQDTESYAGVNPTRSSMSSSSVSDLSYAMSPAPLVDGGCSETDCEISNESDFAVVKVESPAASPTEFRDPAPELGSSPETPTDGSSQATPVPPKRGRGRPRKNVAASPPAKAKAGKAFVRSKTGCITCRKRKKKCDEGKPECYHCEKNGYVCEGYTPKTLWEPGKLRGKKRQSVHLDVVRIPRGPRVLLDGLETDLDLEFFRHYYHRLSPKLSTKGDDPNHNPFLSLVVPLAKEDAAVMHSLLSLSGAHMYNHDQGRSDCWMGKERHRHQAISLMRKDVGEAVARNADVSDAIEACLVLQYQLQIIDHSYSGEHKTHYNGFRGYVKLRTSEPVGRFANEFFEYAHMTKLMTELPEDQYSPLPSSFGNLSSCDEVNFAIPNMATIFDGIMLTVLRGLLPFITEITDIRNRVRSCKAAGMRLNPEMIMGAADLSSALGTWTSDQEEGSPGWVIAELYREAAFVYLHRTIYPSKPDHKLSCSVQQALEYTETLLRHNSATECALLLPAFILGCAAFEVPQRERIRAVFSALSESNHFANVGSSMKIVEKVWELMDEGVNNDGDDRSWDWETIRKAMRYDFPIT